MNWDSRQLSIRTLSSYQESVEGSLIQATGAVEYEDGSWKGNQLRAQNNLEFISYQINFFQSFPPEFEPGNSGLVDQPSTNMN